MTKRKKPVEDDDIIRAVEAAKPDLMKIFTDYIPIKPKVKGRPRMSRRGHVFTPAATVAYERQIGGAYQGNPNAVFFEDEQLLVKIILMKDGFELHITPIDWAPSKLRGDTDNYAKAILDGLNKVAWSDDRQVRVLIVEKQG